MTYQLKILTTAVFSVIMLDKVLGELQYLPNILSSQYVLYTQSGTSGRVWCC